MAIVYLLVNQTPGECTNLSKVPSITYKAYNENLSKALESVKKGFDDIEFIASIFFFFSIY